MTTIPNYRAQGAVASSHDLEAAMSSALGPRLQRTRDLAERRPVDRANLPRHHHIIRRRESPETAG